MLTLNFQFDNTRGSLETNLITLLNCTISERRTEIRLVSLIDPPEESLGTPTTHPFNMPTVTLTRPLSSLYATIFHDVNIPSERIQQRNKYMLKWANKQRVNKLLDRQTISKIINNIFRKLFQNFQKHFGKFTEFFILSIDF